MEELIQIVFVALFVLFGLLGGGRKKRKRRSGRDVEAGSATGTAIPKQRPETRPQRPVQRRRDEFAPTVPHKVGGDVVDEIFDLLRIQVPETPPSPVEPESLTDDEAQSLETLEPAGGASHDRFHSLYMEAPPLTVQTTPRVSPRRRLGLTGRKRLRDAIILTEVLGVPKALRDPTESGPWSGPVG